MLFNLMNPKHVISSLFKNVNSVGRWWLTPVILAIQEAEIRRSWFKVGQIVCKTLSRKNPSHTPKKGLVEWLKV
jgi:hypothetical protein